MKNYKKLLSIWGERQDRSPLVPSVSQTESLSCWEEATEAQREKTAATELEGGRKRGKGGRKLGFLVQSVKVEIKAANLHFQITTILFCQKCAFGLQTILVSIIFDLSLFQESINLQKSFGIRMQLITMNYSISFPESLQMCKWYVYFIINYYCRHTSFYWASQIFAFLLIEGLWPPGIEQVHWYYFSNSICSLWVCHILVILAMFQTFSLLYLLCSCDHWCYCCKKINTYWRFRWGLVFFFFKQWNTFKLRYFFFRCNTIASLTDFHTS